MWNASAGTKQIVCEDRAGHFTARFTLALDDGSDPLVSELHALLAELGDTGWNTLIVSVDQHASWPEIDEGDYFKQITLGTQDGDLTLDYVDDGPGAVLRETGVLSTTSDRPEHLKQQAQDLRTRTLQRGSDTPEVYYLMTKENPTEVRSASAGFPSTGKSCTAQG